MLAKTVALLVLATPVAAQTAADPAPGASTPPAPKLICHREIPTGSIMPGRKICLTTQEWKRVSAAGDGSADSFRNRPIREINQQPGQ